MAPSSIFSSSVCFMKSSALFTDHLSNQSLFKIENDHLSLINHSLRLKMLHFQLKQSHVTASQSGGNTMYDIPASKSNSTQSKVKRITVWRKMISSYSPKMPRPKKMFEIPSTGFGRTLTCRMSPLQLRMALSLRLTR